MVIHYLAFRGTAGPDKKVYEAKIELFGEINPEVSTMTMKISQNSYLFSQGRRQDFAKGGADARREMQTFLRSGASGGHQRPVKTRSWNDWFNFLSLFIPLFSFFFLSLFLSPLSPLSLLFFFGPPLPTPLVIQ